MILYQLCASGESALTGKYNKILSQKVFTSKAMAEEKIPEFEKYVTSPYSSFDVFYLSSKNLKIEIGQIEVVNE